jgi:hypothetical protein
MAFNFGNLAFLNQASAPFGAAKKLGLFGGGSKQVDISAELAMIRAQLDKARQAAVANVKTQAGQVRSRQTQDLAAAGILRSPVRGYQTQRTDDAELAAIGQVEGDFAMKSAGIESQLLSQLLGQRFQDEQRRGSQKAALFGTIGSVAGNLALASYLGPAAPMATSAISGLMQRKFFPQSGMGPDDMRGNLSITQPLDFPGVSGVQPGRRSFFNF